MKQFNKGWWCCFCSYTEEMADRVFDCEFIFTQQLDAAGVTKDEISFVLKNNYVGEKTRKLLMQYNPIQ